MKKIFCLIGPSASGKTTLGKYLKEQAYLEIISDTTRAPRTGEIHGLHYYFRTNEEFDKLRKLEDVRYAGNRYCTSMNEIDKKLAMNCKGLYVVVTYEGYEVIKSYYKHTTSVFINLDKDTCIKRMKERGDSKEAISSRIINFENEKEFDNKKKCDVVIDNFDYETACEQLSNMIKRG